MWSLQEIADKAKTQLDNIRVVMDKYGYYHPDLETPNHQPASIYNGLSRADEMELRETLNKLSLSELLAKTGPFGNAYLVATKLHDTLIMASQETDIVPLISMSIVSRWPEANLDIPICEDTSYRPIEFASGGNLPEVQTATTTKATITPISFGLAPLITSDMLEDSQYDLIEFYATKAARGIGWKATNLALTVLRTATGGVGTVYSSATGNADETKYTGGGSADILDAFNEVAKDEFLANSLVCTPEAWHHSIIETATATTQFAISPSATAQGFHCKLNPLNLDVLFSVSPMLHASTDAQGAAFTDCVSIVFDRNNALLTGRKRWMQINNYANPIEDLAGCAITCRQGSVTIYNDSIAVLTET